MLFCCRSESDIPVTAAPVIAVEADQLEQSAKVRATLLAEEEPGGDSDSTAAVENTSFSVDELTTRLRKSLTLEDQNESFAAVEQEAAETDLESNAIKTLSEEHPANESSTFFDCENKSFDGSVLPKTVVEPTQDIADNHLPAQSEVNVPEAEQTAETEDIPDSNSLEVVEKMADSSNLPQSPPIAVMKGSYTINWDELDENTDPTMLKKHLLNSPPKSPVMPACIGAGEGTSVGEVDAFKSSHSLSDSPPGAVGDGSSVKQTQRRSVNNNLPEPVTDSKVASPADNGARSYAVDNMSLDSQNKTPSTDDDKRSDVVQSQSPTIVE